MVSIIVPIFNTEKYLRRCIDSVLSQTYKDFELLLIDDGSTDTSDSICDEYAAKDARVKVFHKANGGVSSARNLGLHRAIGKYVVFVDSDDWVKSDYIENLMSCLDADLRVSNYELHDSLNDGNSDLPDIDVFDACELPYFYNKFFLQNFASPWAKRFKMEIIQKAKIEFPKNLSLGEDAAFVMHYLRYVDSLSLSNQRTYVYNLGNGENLSSTLNPNQCKRFFYAIDEMVEEVENIRKMDLSLLRLEFLNINYFRVLKAILYSKESKKWKHFELCKLLCSSQVKRIAHDEVYIRKGVKYRVVIFFIRHHFYRIAIKLIELFLL